MIVNRWKALSCPVTELFAVPEIGMVPDGSFFLGKIYRGGMAGKENTLPKRWLEVENREALYASV